MAGEPQSARPQEAQPEWNHRSSLAWSRPPGCWLSLPDASSGIESSSVPVSLSPPRGSKSSWDHLGEATHLNSDCQGEGGEDSRAPPVSLEDTGSALHQEACDGQGVLLR